MKAQLAIDFLKHVFVFGVEAKMISPEEIPEEEADDVTSIPQTSGTGFKAPETRKG